MNSQNVLHGDIKEPNVILEMGEDGQKHVSYIDLDLMLLIEKQKDLTTEQERYTRGYKAPWIMNPTREIIEIVKYKEDLYAIGITWSKLININYKELDVKDTTLRMVNDLVNDTIIKPKGQSVFKPNAIPNTYEFMRLLENTILLSIQEKQKEKNQIVLDQQPPITNAKNQKMIRK